MLGLYLFFISFCYCTQQKDSCLRFVVVDLSGKEELFLNENDIEIYDWEKHEIYLKSHVLDNLKNVVINDGYTFKVYLFDKEIILGNFVSSVATFDTSKPIIYYESNNRLFIDNSNISFEMKCYNCNEGSNPLNNKELYIFLKEKKLLMSYNPDK